MIAPRRLLRCMLVIAVTVLTAQIASQAYAQQARGAKRAAQPTAEELEKKRKAKEVDDAYRASLRAIPNKPAKSDPWGGMR